MAKKDRVRVRLVTDSGRLSFPNLFEPRSEMSDGTKFPAPRYDATLLIPPDAKGLPELRAAIGKILVEEFGPNWKQNAKLRERLPLKLVDTSKPYYADKGLEGWFALSASNMQQQPGIVDANRQPIINPRDIYAGCWARFQVTLYAYNKAGNQGVSAALDNVQMTADGERFGGGIESAEDAFAGVGITLPDGVDAPAGKAEPIPVDPRDIF